MVTSTTITERSAVSSPSYTERGAVSSPVYTARGTITNPYYQGTSETETDQTAPVLSGFRAEIISFTYVVFAWETNEPGTCIIQYGDSDPPSAADSVVSHTHLVISGRTITAADLARGSTYYVRGLSADAYGNIGATPDIYVFTTADTGDAGGRPIEV